MTKSKSKVVNIGCHQEFRQQTLRQLFEEHRSGLKTFLIGRMGDSPDMDDVMQEVFMRLAKMPDLSDRVSVGRGSMRAYILTIANNLLVDLVRHRKVQRQFVEVEQPLLSEISADQSPETIAEQQQELQAIQLAISKLKPAERKAFVLSRFKYMSYKEISGQLGVSPRTVEDYIGSALMKIRKAVARVARS